MKWTEKDLQILHKYYPTEGVFDDLCDGGGTFFAIHKALQDIGVTDVHLRVRHAIQKEPLVKLSKLYKTITITNFYKDWDKEELPNNIKVIKVYD